MLSYLNFLSNLHIDSKTNRYAFRSTEKVALQEIGPRFTLKLRSLRKGLPAVKNLGAIPTDLEFDTTNASEDVEKVNEESRPTEDTMNDENEQNEEPDPNPKKTLPPTEDEYQWVWKVWNSHCFDVVDLLTVLFFFSRN